MGYHEMVKYKRLRSPPQYSANSSHSTKSHLQTACRASQRGEFPLFAQFSIVKLWFRVTYHCRKDGGVTQSLMRANHGASTRIVGQDAASGSWPAIRTAGLQG